MPEAKKLLPTSFAFGRALRRLREERGLSQLDLALSAGLNAQYVYRLERGLHDICWSKAIALAHALGASLEDFT
jgi:transcriptional regulator with XRE-family HTH domain